LGHIASDSPNRKVISLAEWESIKEEEEEETMEGEEASPKEEVTKADKAEMLVLQ